MYIDKNIQTLIERGALFIVNHSGGKDSQAMLIEIAAHIPTSQIIVVHATLGEIEWKGALELAQKQAADLGVPFIVAKANWKDGSDKTFLNMAERRFAMRPDVPSFPSSEHRQCTSDLKRTPIEREIRRYVAQSGHTLLVNCEGIRAAESASRAKYEPFKAHRELSKAGREAYVWLPIFDLSTDEVFDTIRAAGQEPHWAYKAGNERLSCVFCIFGSKRDLANGARHNPELFERYVAMEKATGYTMHQSRTPLADLVREGEAQLKKTNLISMRNAA